MPGLACGAFCLDLGPQAFIGGSDLPGNGTGHLRRQMKTSADLVIGAILASVDLIAHLAMRKGVLAHIIERITIGQLHRSQAVNAQVSYAV